MRIVVRSWLFVLAGLVVTGVEVWGSGEYLLGQLGHISYVVALACAVTAAASLLPMAAETAWHEGRYVLALVLLVCIMPASATIFLAAVERTGSVRDKVVMAQDDATNKKAAALKTEAAAEKDLADQLAVEQVECRSGRKQKCIDQEERTAAARDRLQKARAAVVVASSKPLDAQARRISAMLHVEEITVQLYAPIVLPVTGSLLGALFLAVGARMQSRQPEPVRVARVHQEHPVKLEISADATHDDPMPRQQGSVSRFMLDCMPVSSGRRVEIAEAFLAYRQWCADENVEPKTALEFRNDFMAICKRAKIATKRAGELLYVEGRMIAA